LTLLELNTFKKAKRFFRMLDMLRKVSITFEKPQEADIVIFERTNEDYIIPLCKDKKYFIADVPPRSINLKLPMLFGLLYSLIKKESLLASYYKYLFSVIKPKIVITFIDNSNRFYDIARLDHENRRYLAIQNGSRYDVLELNQEDSSRIFLPEFACLGNYEVDMYKEKKADVFKFYPLGSLREAYYRRYRTNKNDETIIFEFDLCVVAEASPDWDKLYPGVEDAIGKIAQYASRLASEDGLKMVIAGKRDVSNTNTRAYIHTIDSETNWYQKYLGVDCIIQPRVRNEFTTYETISKSRLSLALVSTALREGMSRGSRVLYCNFSDNSLWNFHSEGLISLNIDDYKLFKERVLNILSLSDTEYLNQTKEISSYSINNQKNSDAITELENLIHCE